MKNLVRDGRLSGVELLAKGKLSPMGYQAFRAIVLSSPLQRKDFTFEFIKKNFKLLEYEVKEVIELSLNWVRIESEINAKTSLDLEGKDEQI
jgi:hypothetical protein